MRRAALIVIDGLGIGAAAEPAQVTWSAMYAAVAARVYRAFGPGSIEQLQEDPYALTQLDGIGFATADALAQALGVPLDHPGRLDAGIMHALALAEDDGHCYLPRAELEDRSLQGHGQTETAPGCVEAVDEGRELFLLDLDPLVAPVQPQTGVGGSVQSRRERMLNG